MSPRFKLLFLLIISFSSTSAQQTSIYPASTLYINRGEGFLFHLDLPSPLFEIRECRLVLSNGAYIQLTSNSVEVTETFETIQSLDTASSICGARVHNFTYSSPSTWRLEVYSTDESIAMIYGTLRVDILDSIPESLITTESGLAGHFGTVHCPGDYNEQRHCEITDPQGKLIESCEAPVKYPAVGSAIQVYHCRVFFWGRITAVESQIHVHSYETPAKVLASVEETADHVVLSCAVDGESFSVCRAEMLNSGTQFLIMDGFQSNRYSSWNTVLDNGLCQFEIPQPIAGNETGVWRIHGRLKSSLDEWTGCVFHVKADLQAEYEAFKMTLNSWVNIETTSDTIELQCGNTPYPLDYCYLVTPVQEVIRPSVRKMELFKSYGRCTFTGVETMTGRYRCGFNSMNHVEEDLVMYFDVQHKDPNVFVEVQREEVIINEEKPEDGSEKPLQLMCFALQDFSISSCTFVAPSGDLYHLPNASYANNRFAYFGKGFEKGECGLELKSVEEERFTGNWTCSVTLIDKSAQFNAYIMVKREQDGSLLNLPVGAIAGISIAGVVALTGVIIGCVVFLKRRRRRRNQINE